MASRTKVTETRRAIKKATVGKKRKNRQQNFGSTAVDLPLNMPNANERAQQAKKKKA